MLVGLALLILVWLVIRIDRRHEREMTGLHEACSVEIQALQAEVAGLHLMRGARGR
jgi:hypothetical protein